MARPNRTYVCNSCGAVSNKWAGRCDACGEWNSITEEAGLESKPKGLGGKRGRTIEFVGLQGEEKHPPRSMTHIGEFDRVCGGGLVKGSAVLIGGDPGIGKSTLLLQVVCTLAKNTRCAYISGEEAIDQIRMRASRLGLEKADVELASATNVRDIVTTLEKNKIEVVVIDSIQTMYIDSIESAPGTVSQVRASAQELITIAKAKGITVLLVGHVTKEGTIAGPRVLEHMVDTVLYFEGDRGHHFRILRAVKNRFGPANEIGVFEMNDDGLGEVLNPSELFLSQRRDDISGSAVFAGLEGTRPVLVEIQALVAPSSLATPRRAVIGWDSSRLAMVLAVLEARCGLQLGGNDIYLNIAGGLRINEPAADLAVAAALISSMAAEPMPADTVVFGEIGLSGEIRAVGQAETRLKEAEKLGFGRALAPELRRKGQKKNQISSSGLAVTELGHITELLPLFETARQALAGE